MKLLRNLGFMVIGIFFGVVLIKAEVVSWWRIQEMFHFQSFHMYGIIGSGHDRRGPLGDPPQGPQSQVLGQVKSSTPRANPSTRWATSPAAPSLDSAGL
jgi:hypothetical protein